MNPSIAWHSAVFDVTYGGARNATRALIGPGSGRADGLLGLLPPSGGSANSADKSPNKSPSDGLPGEMARVGGELHGAEGRGHYAGDETDDLPRWRRPLRWARGQLVALVGRLPKIGRN